jgi:hypothetical protein
MLTVAAGIALPDGSFTTPDIKALNSWALAATHARHKRQIQIHNWHFFPVMQPPAERPICLGMK